MMPCMLLTPGTVPYNDASRLQRELAAARRREEIPDLLLLLEHPPVVTVGRGGSDGGLLVGQDELLARGIAVHESPRGGKVSYHGPGQLVGYPVLDLSRHGRDLNAYLRKLELALIESLVGFDVPAFRRPGLTGVWTEHGKIAAIGIAVRHWITSHGFALNVSCDLAPFELIDPCGLGHLSVTSMARELGQDPPLETVQKKVAVCFAEQFGLELLPHRLDDIARIADHIPVVGC